MDLILKKGLYRGTGELVWTLKIGKIPISWSLFSIRGNIKFKNKHIISSSDIIRGVWLA